MPSSSTPRGSNEGMWSVLAASYGMRVLAIDPQQLCLDLLNVAVKENGLSHVQAHLNILAPNPRNALMVPTDQCHGTSLFAFDGRSGSVSDATMPGRALVKSPERVLAKRVAVQAVRLDTLVAAERVVEMWHLDVEGAELQVLASAARLFEAGRIRRVMLEFIPFRWSSHGYGGVNGVERGLQEAQALLAGWDCRIVCPQRRQHHGIAFNFSRETLEAHMWIKRGKTVCENLYCVAPGVQPHAPWR